MSFNVALADIAPQVIVGFCDLDGSSLKACEALGAAPGCTRTRLDLQIPGEPSPTQALVSGDAGGDAACSSAATLINIHAAPGGTPQVSIIAVNAVLPVAKQAQVAAAIVQLAAVRQQQGPLGGQQGCLFVLASALVQQSSHKGVHTICTSAAKGLPLVRQIASTCPPLPPSSQLKDNMLALLHHAAEATGTSACLLLSPGFRPPAGSQAEVESREGARLLVAALLQAFGSEAAAAAGVGAALSADLGRIERVTLQHAWFPEGRSHGQQDNIYC